MVIKFQFPAFYQIFPSLGCWLAVLIHNIFNVPVKVSSTRRRKPWLQRSKWKISCRCGTGKEMGQISASKDIAYEMVLTVKPGVHGDCRGWRTEKGLHNSSVTKSYFGSRDHHAGIPFQLSCEFPSHRTAQKPRSRGQSSLLPESLHDWV